MAGRALAGGVGSSGCHLPEPGMESIMRTNVTFDSAGLKLAGHLYTPEDQAVGPRPAIVVGHPGRGVKEQAAGLYAERLSHAGFMTLTFDSAYQGESEGTPRGLE